MKCGFNEWTVRWTKSSWTSVPRALWRVIWYSKKKELPSPAHGVEQPQPPVHTRGAQKAAQQIFDGKESRESQTLLSGALWHGRCHGHRTELLRFLVNTKGDLYCEGEQWDRFPREAVWSLHPWRYLKPSPGHNLDAAWAQGWAELSMEFPHCPCELWHGLQIRIVSERMIRTEARFFFCWRCLSLLTHDAYFSILWEDYTFVLCVFLFFLSCSCCLSEKKVITDFQMTAGLMKLFVWRPNVASMPVSSSLYWALCGEDNGLSFYLPLRWFMHHVCKTFLKSKLRYSVNLLLLSNQKPQAQKKIVEGEKSNISVFSQSCVECAFIWIIHWGRNWVCRQISMYTVYHFFIFKNFF